MKKIILSLVILSFFLQPISALAINLVLNPDFEASSVNQSVPDFWHEGGWGNNQRSFVYPASGSSGNGAKVSISSYSDGDAKWYFEEVPVKPYAVYRFSDRYFSDISSQIVAQVRLNNDTFTYLFGQILSETNGTWQIAENNFMMPANASSATVFHLINQIGQMTIDDYLFEEILSPENNIFESGMVSLSFDDGWLSQYQNAFPILKNAGVQGTFFLMSQQVADPGINLLLPANEPDLIVTKTASGTIWTGIYTDPNIDNFVFRNKYNSDQESAIKISYTLPDNSASSTKSINFPSGTNQSLEYAFRLPLLKLNTPISVSHLSEGQLVTSEESLIQETGYLNISQALEMQSNGQELGGHSKTHANLTLVNQSAALEEILSSKNILESSGIQSISSFAYPYGAFNEQIKSIVKDSGYKLARTVDAGYNLKTSDIFALKTKNVVLNTSFENDIKNWIDSALTDKTWLILVFHQIDSMDALTRKSQTEGSTPEILQTTVNYLLQKQARTVTLKDGLEIINGKPSPPPSPTWKPQCSDGIDNDQDGFIDYPSDQQCQNSEYDSEAGLYQSSGGSILPSPTPSPSPSPTGQVLGASTTDSLASPSPLPSPTPNICLPYLTKNLGFGSRGEEVKKLQNFLIENNFLKPNENTGYFGRITKTAVKNFQLQYKNEILSPLGLKDPTGFVGPNTRRVINQLACSQE